jgi:hypothetical protein
MRRNGGGSGSGSGPGASRRCVALWGFLCRLLQRGLVLTVQPWPRARRRHWVLKQVQLRGCPIGSLFGALRFLELSGLGGPFETGPQLLEQSGRDRAVAGLDRAAVPNGPYVGAGPVNRLYSSVTIQQRPSPSPRCALTRGGISTDESAERGGLVVTGTTSSWVPCPRFRMPTTTTTGRSLMPSSRPSWASRCHR